MRRNYTIKEEIKIMAQLTGYPVNFEVKFNGETTRKLIIGCEREFDDFVFKADKYAILYDNYQNRLVYSFWDIEDLGV